MAAAYLPHEINAGALLEPNRAFIEGNILNISSAIVYARPGTDSTVRQQLLQVPGVEVHAASEDGKIIATIEAENDRAAMEIYESVARLPDVLNVAMIFQQTESNPDQEVVTCK